MTAEYSKDMLQISVANILQTFGWTSSRPTPLEVITDILKEYICQIGKRVNAYANQYNCLEPSLDHLGLVFHELNINLEDLADYIKYIDFGQLSTPVPNYPIPKETHLNFLKPGSKEVVTRPIHIHEYFPPMMCINNNYNNENENIKRHEPVAAIPTTHVLKRPCETSLEESFKRRRMLMGEDGRPREISSVIMTRSGYLSKAREGKLPKPQTPSSASDTVITISSDNSSDSSNKSCKTNTYITHKKSKYDTDSFQIHTPTDDNLKINKILHSNNNTTTATNVIVESANFGEKQNEVMRSRKKKEAVKKLFKLLPEKNETTQHKRSASIEPLVTTIKVSSSPKTIYNVTTTNKFHDKTDRRKNVSKIFQLSNRTKDITRKNEISFATSTSNSINISSSHDNYSYKSCELTKTFENKQNNHKLKIQLSENKINNKSKKVYSEHEMIKLKEQIQTKTYLPSKTNNKIVEQKLYNINKELKVSHQRTISPLYTASATNYENTAKLFAKPDKKKMNIFKKISKLKKSQEKSSDSTHYKTDDSCTNKKYEILNTIKDISGSARPSYVTTLRPTDDNLQNNLPCKEIEGKSKIITTNSFKFHSFNDSRKNVFDRNKMTRSYNLAECTIVKPNTSSLPMVPVINYECFSSKFSNCNMPIKPRHSLLTMNKQYVSSTLVKETKHKIEKRPKDKWENKPLETYIIDKKLKRKKEQQSKENDKEKSLTPKLNTYSSSIKLTEGTLITESLETRSTKATTSPSSALFLKNKIKNRDPTFVKLSPKSKIQQSRLHIHTLKKQPSIPKKKFPYIVDTQGNKIWICPECKKEDDGRPMIGCDGCDAWYHWYCVGIYVAPECNEDWYCSYCKIKETSDIKKKQ